MFISSTTLDLSLVHASDEIQLTWNLLVTTILVLGVVYYGILERIIDDGSVWKLLAGEFATQIKMKRKVLL